MADWVKFRVDRLSHEQMQRSLDNEQGGMNEALANLYARHRQHELPATRRSVQPPKVLDPLEHGEDG